MPRSTFPLRRAAALLAGAGSAASGACRDASAPPAALRVPGTYVLDSVAGRALPSLVFQAGHRVDVVFADTLVLRADGSFTDIRSDSVEVSGQAPQPATGVIVQRWVQAGPLRGTWSAAGDQVTLQYQTATDSSGRLFYSIGGAASFTGPLAASGRHVESRYDQVAYVEYVWHRR